VAVDRYFSAMKILLTILCISLLQFHTTPAAAKAPVTKQTLRVLYVGGTADVNSYSVKEDLSKSVQERMESFEAFLNEYFTTVKVVKGSEYTQQMSDDYDVTILDDSPKPLSPKYVDASKELYMSYPVYFTEDFDRPVLTIADTGERVGRRIGLKNDWYCLCLDADAHSWRAEHPIFHGPFAVNMTVVDKPTPKDAYHYHYYHDGPMPETLPMWSVQTKGFATDEKFRIGMVSRPWGYEDSPDTEYISSGVCQKTLDAVALGRHANFFHWGFAASPRYMTEEAKPVLANAIVYISKFAGQKPIARKYNDRIATREYLKELKYLLSREAYEERLKSDEEWNKQLLSQQAEAQKKQARGETLNAQETSVLKYTPQPPMAFDAMLKRYGKHFYDMFGTDTEAYAKYFDENHDYFYGGEGSYMLTLDEDVKSLGIANNDKRLLDAAITLLEKGVQTDKAKRILARYTLVDFATPKEWRMWYETNKDNIFFTETGGWYFLVNSKAAGVNDYASHAERVAAAKMTVGETSDEEPVAIATDVLVRYDGTRVLNIKMKIHPGYHVYDAVATTDAFSPTVVTVKLPEGYVMQGDMIRPFGIRFSDNGTTVYEDEAVFSQEFTGSGKGKIECTVSYQCCDDHICFPPVDKNFTIELK
jgi:ribosomal protein S17E